MRESKASETRSTPRVDVATVTSVLALPFGILVLFSFGGQLVLGPFVLAIEWILARISPRPLRYAWSLLAGALIGEIAVIVIDTHLLSLDSYLIVITWILVAASTALLVYRTSARPHRIQPTG